MYLSRLTLNPRDRNVRRDLANCHELHRTLLCAFEDLPGTVDNAREQLGVLHRVETDRRRDLIRVLVQSRARPDWSKLPNNYLRPADPFDDEDSVVCKEIDGVWNGIAAGTELVFRLRANPTRRISAKAHPEDPLAKKRVELQTEPEWDAWVRRQGERCGFEVLTVRASATGDDRERMAAVFAGDLPESLPAPGARVADVRASPGVKLTGRKPGVPKLAFGSVLFEGRLRVTDPDAFRRALSTGVGPGKAYGFGLLSIARP